MKRCPTVSAVILAVLLYAGVLAGCGQAASTAIPPFPEPTAGPALSPLPGARVWVVGYQDFIAASTDGGATWTRQHETPAATAAASEAGHTMLYGVAFADRRRGYAVGMRTVYTTSDGGSTWTGHALAQRTKLTVVACSDARHAWALGSRDLATDSSWSSPATRAEIWATSDGGRTWRRQDPGRHDALLDIVFADARHGWAVGADGDASTPQGSQGFILATSDGGAHWRLQKTVKDVPLLGVTVTSARRGWAVGGENMTGGFVLATRDGGAHWTTQLAKAASPLTSVAFPDARHGWAVGGGGLILATADGGATWTTQRSGQTFRLRKVSFASASDGWAIIGNAHLLATRDGGRTWRVINPLPGYHLLADTASLPIVRQ